MDVRSADRATLEGSDPKEFFSVAWGPAEEVLLEAPIGDSSGQARWEAYTVLLAVSTWRRLFANPVNRVILVGDAEGVLHGAVTLHSKDPVINKVFGEVALLIGPSGGCLKAVHYWSEDNEVADALSRSSQGAPLPHCCRHSRRRDGGHDPWRWLGR